MIIPAVAIVHLFSEEYRRELTIHEVAKLLKQPYATVNNHIHELITRGVLVQRKIGNALLCKLDYVSEETIALLVYDSLLRRAEYLKNLPDERRKQILSMKGEILFFDGAVHAVNERQTGSFKPGDVDYNKLVIIRNAEAFWRAVAR